jgi:CBS domain-containing protein
MAEKIRDVMSNSLTTFSSRSSMLDAAQAMLDKDIGAVIVLKEGGELCGIVTDRDLVIRGLARGMDPQNTQLSQICTSEVTHLSPDDSVDDAVKLMRERAIRRIPIMENGSPVGIVSLGDLAIDRDRRSALGSISAAPPSH